MVTAWPEAKVTDIDGIRLDTEKIMVVVRASQNGPYITVRFEGLDQKLYNETKDKLNNLLKRHLEIDWEDTINGYALTP